MKSTVLLNTTSRIKRLFFFSLFFLPGISFAARISGGGGSGSGSGSSVYPATATASFPFGLSVSTLTVTNTVNFNSIGNFNLGSGTNMNFTPDSTFNLKEGSTATLQGKVTVSTMSVGILNVTSSMTANVPVTLGTTTVKGSLSLGGGLTSITGTGIIATSKQIQASGDVKFAIGDALYVRDFAIADTAILDSGGFTGNAQSVSLAFNPASTDFDNIFWGSGGVDPVQVTYVYSAGSIQTLWGSSGFQLQTNFIVNGQIQSLAQTKSRGLYLNGNGVITSLDLPISSRTVAGSVAGSGTYGNVVFIPLTSSGTWTLSGLADLSANGATVTQWQVAVSTNSGNTTTDQNAGDNQLSGTLPTTVFDGGQTIPNYIVTLTNQATAYLKVNAAYSVATPKAAGSLKAIKLYQ